MKIDFEREKLLQFFYALKEQEGEGLLRINKDGLKFFSTDVPGACYIEASFNVPLTEEFNIAIDVQKFYSTINALKTKSISIDFGKTCQFKGGKIERSVMSLVEAVLREQSPPPEMTYPALVEAPCSDLIDFLESVEKMGTEEGALPVKVFVELKDKKFTLYSINELHERTQSEFDMISIEKDSKTPLRSGFAFDYLIKIAKNIKKTKIDNVKFFIGNNYPCKLLIENEYLNISWMLAPRIEDD